MQVAFLFNPGIAAELAFPLELDEILGPLLHERVNGNDLVSRPEELAGLVFQVVYRILGQTGFGGRSEKGVSAQEELSRFRNTRQEEENNDEDSFQEIHGGSL
jgi:hypothetical protein